MTRSQTLGLMAAQIAGGYLARGEGYNFDEVVHDADALLREAERVSPEPTGVLTVTNPSTARFETGYVAPEVGNAR